MTQSDIKERIYRMWFRFCICLWRCILYFAWIVFGWNFKVCAGGGGPCGRSADLIISYPHATVSHATFDQYFLLLSYPQTQMKRQIQIHNCMLFCGSFGSLFLYHLPPMWILIYSQYYKRAHVYKFYINSIVAYETRKMQVVWRKMWKCIKDYCVFLPRGLDVAVRGGSRIRCWRQLWGGDNSDKVKEHQRITCICTLVFILFVYLVCNCICLLYGICSALMMAIW